MCCTAIRAQDPTTQSQDPTTQSQDPTTQSQPPVTQPHNPVTPSQIPVTPQARAARDSTNTADIFTTGIGFGQDYGLIGFNITVYPQKNVGLFLGAGFAVAGFGYNAGIKLRALPNHGRSIVRPFLLGMYGYVEAVAVTHDPQYNKIFYGPTVGGGIDIGPTTGKGYLSLAIFVPFRSPDVQNYIDELRASGVTINNNLVPVTFSIGYKFILN
jgi:hypothetical protein